MATKTIPATHAKSGQPAAAPNKAPADKAAIDEMGAEDESPTDARHSKDKNPPAKPLKK